MRNPQVTGVAVLVIAVVLLFASAAIAEESVNRAKPVFVAMLVFATIGAVLIGL